MIDKDYYPSMIAMPAKKRLELPIMAATTHLMTVEEFQSLPEGRGDRQELHHGELITLPPPKLKHSLIQRNLRRLLEAAAEPGSLVDKEMAFRPFPEYEFWVADVGYLSADRFRQANPEDNIRGTPEIIIEVLSPSNTAAEMLDKERICLTNGAREFWLVDPDLRRIKVTTHDGRTTTFESGQQIPLIFGPEAQVNVDDIFRY
jgi:Uma2 family endonuclease